MPEWTDNLHHEIAKGGSEAPCPFCRVPRLRRSDYIRCARCAINWLDGEPLDRDPRPYRQAVAREQASASQTVRKKPPAEEEARTKGRMAR